MSMWAAAKFVLGSNPLLLMRLDRTLRELYRASFVSTAGAEGVLALLREGPKPLKEMHDALELAGCEAELGTWLDLGVGLGELAVDERGYRLRGTLSKQFALPHNDHNLAYLQARVEVLARPIREGPALLRERQRLPLSDEYGEMFARSSRMVEPLLMDVVDQVVPPSGACRMLEVGCGSGSYIRRACERNADLDVVGIDLTEEIVSFSRANLEEWGLADRVTVEVCDVRRYTVGEPFDLLTFYNLIYYFPEDERLDLLRHLHSLLKPGGRLALASLTPHRSPGIQTMDLWASMTEGCGPLPRPERLREQLQEAGFTEKEDREVIPSFRLFVARA